MYGMNFEAICLKSVGILQVHRVLDSVGPESYDYYRRADRLQDMLADYGKNTHVQQDSRFAPVLLEHTVSE